MLYQNPPHQLARNRKEMGAALPLHALVIHQSHVGFIHQGRSLQAVAGALVFHVVLRQSVQLFVDDGSQPVEGTLVSVTPGAEERADIACSPLTRLCSLLHRVPAHYTAASSLLKSQILA